MGCKNSKEKSSGLKYDDDTPVSHDPDRKESVQSIQSLREPDDQGEKTVRFPGRPTAMSPTKSTTSFEDPELFDESDDSESDIDSDIDSDSDEDIEIDQLIKLKETADREKSMFERLETKADEEEAAACDDDGLPPGPRASELERLQQFQAEEEARLEAEAEAERQAAEAKRQAAEQAEAEKRAVWEAEKRKAREEAARKAEEALKEAERKRREEEEAAARAEAEAEAARKAEEAAAEAERTARAEAEAAAKKAAEEAESARQAQEAAAAEAEKKAAEEAEAAAQRAAEEAEAEAKRAAEEAEAARLAAEAAAKKAAEEAAEAAASAAAEELARAEAEREKEEAAAAAAAAEAEAERLAEEARAKEAAEKAEKERQREQRKAERAEEARLAVERMKAEQMSMRRRNKSIRNRREAMQNAAPTTAAGISLGAELNALGPIGEGLPSPPGGSRLQTPQSSGASVGSGMSSKQLRKSMRKQAKSIRKAQSRRDRRSRRHGPGGKGDGGLVSTPKQPLVRKPGSVTVAEIDAGNIDNTEFEKLDDRAIEAARWTDKSVRQLISEIQGRGDKNSAGQVCITFGKLFDETANIFDALVGILKTAKKYHVLYYDADQLWQGKDDNVVITMLKDTHPGVVINRRRNKALGGGKAGKDKGFGSTSLATENKKCHICKKTVYPMEFVGASGLAFHKNCFRCLVCKNVLKQTDYCTVDSKFYCTPHYTQMVNAAGGPGAEHNADTFSPPKEAQKGRRLSGEL